MNVPSENPVPSRTGDRPAFVVTRLGAGYAPATQPICAQTAISTGADGLIEGEVQVPVRDGEMVAYRAAPQGAGRAPAILVVSEIFGVHEYIRDVCRRLAKLGYFAVAPELFARQGDPATYASIPELMAGITAKTPDAQVLSDLDATVAWAAAQGADTGRLAITGFCWGGRIVWLYAAHNPALKAAVAWYGKLTAAPGEMTPRHPLDVVEELQAPVLGLYGSADAGIPLDTVERMQAALQAARVPAAQASTIRVYDDAPHAFHADYRPSYRQDAAEDGWRRLQDWLRKNGV